MVLMTIKTAMHDTIAALTATVVALPVPAGAASWTPEQNVEFIVNCAPGCGPDRMACLMQRVFQMIRWIDPAITIQNKTGGVGAVA